MKIPCTFHPVLVAALLAISLTPSFVEGSSSSLLDETQLQKRVNRLQTVVTPRYDETVKKYIRNYVIYGRKGAEEMIERSHLYFPIFEYYLEVLRLPEQLKFLPVIESELKPNAVSHAGAAGLWQLMHGTASDLGLRITNSVDERRDPYRATEAALRYLSSLYDDYGNWELALAAYNCGPGNVNKAIRSTGSKDFWKIKHLLPAETQDYIPRFIAANYVMEYRKLHELEGAKPAYDLLFTSAIRVYSQISLETISSISRVPLETIQKLNPAYHRGFIPANSKGNFLVLPQMGMEAFRDYLRWSANDAIRTDIAQVSTQVLKEKGLTPVTVTVNDKNRALDDIAYTYNCTVDQIKAWNNLQQNKLYFRQQLVLLVTEEVKKRLNA